MKRYGYLNEDHDYIDNDDYDYIDDDQLTDEDYARSEEVIKAFKSGFREGYADAEAEQNELAFEESVRYSTDDIDDEEETIYPSKPNSLYRRINTSQPDQIGLFTKPYDDLPEYVIDTNMTDWCDKVNHSIMSNKGTVLRLVRFTPAGFDTDYEGLLTVLDEEGYANQYYVRFK